MKLRLGEGGNKRFTGKGIAKRLVALALAAAGTVTCLTGCAEPLEPCFRNGNEELIPTSNHFYVVPDRDGEYKIVLTKRGLLEVLTGERLKDDDGNRYFLGNYLTEGVEFLGNGQEGILLPAKYHAWRLEDILTEEERKDTLDKREIEEIYSYINARVQEASRNAEWPGTSEVQYGNEVYTGKCLAVFYRVIDNGERETPETVIGNYVWKKSSNGRLVMDTKYFYDITDNTLKCIYDENGNLQYRHGEWIDDLAYSFGLQKSSYTVEDLEGIRRENYECNENFWNKKGFSDFELEPLFPEDEGTVSLAGIEEIAYDDASIEAMDSVRDDIQQAEATIGDNQVEQGE